MSEDERATVIVLAPTRKEFGCGVCDQTRVLVDRLREIGTPVKTVHYDGKPFTEDIGAQAGDLVFLQLSIYGYSRRGVPNWLPSVLAQLRLSRVHVVTFFHELWVSWARITSSAFWLSPLQYSICRRILSNSDVAIFNAEWGYDWAARNSGAKIHYRTTFSNVGEPDKVMNWSKRENNLVVFGNVAARLNIYMALEDYARSNTDALQELQIIDIGASDHRLDKFLSRQGTLSSLARDVTVTGPLDSAAISQILGNSKFGLFEASWHHAGKSSVLASYRAHGVCPISIHPRNHIRGRAKFAPKPDVHFALLGNMRLESAHQSAVYAGIAAAANQSYMRSQSIADLLVNETSCLARIKAVLP